mgnify:CR=1 FL=1
MEKHITAPLKESDIKDLKAGDYVYITGTIYTARDAAHKRMYETIGEHKELPIKMQDTVIYYMGPSPARQGRPIGSAGPTTASRMDKYAPTPVRSRFKGNDWKGKALPGSQGCHCAEQGRLLCGNRRCGGTAFTAHKII